jgi:hypothetical protein
MAKNPEPYVPDMVPSLNSETAMADLERFLVEQLQAISIAIQQTSVSAAYGSLYITASSGNQLLTTTDQILDAWDTVAPAVPNRTLPDPALNNITIYEAGDYYISVGTASTVSTDVFIFTIYVNGIATDVGTTIDPSNQTDFFGISIMGMSAMAAGDVIDVRGRVLAGTGTIDTVSGTFNVFRISETQK